MACSAQVVHVHSVHADRKLMHVHLRRSVKVVRLPHHHRRRQARQQAGVVAGGRETGRAPTVNAAAVVRKCQVRAATLARGCDTWCSAHSSIWACRHAHIECAAQFPPRPAARGVYPPNRCMT